MLKVETKRTETPAIGNVESFFPALDIIRRAGPPPKLRSEVENAVMSHLGSNIWHIRELAARTTGTLMLHETWLDAMTSLLQCSDMTSNRTHGVLMTARFVLERRTALGMTVGKFMKTSPFRLSLTVLSDETHKNKLLELLCKHITLDTCPTTQAAFLSVENYAMSLILYKHEQCQEGAQLQARDITFLTLDYAGAQHTDLDALNSPTQFNHAGVALLECERVRKAVYMAAIGDDMAALSWALTQAMSNSATLALTFLEVMIKVCDCAKSIPFLQSVLDALMTITESSTSADIRASAVTALAKLFDDRYGMNEEVNEIVHSKVQYLRSIVRVGPRSPSLSNAEIRISGCIMTSEMFCCGMMPNSVLQRRFEEWGWMLSEAGHANNVSSKSRHLSD